jgi:hypothetical protein
MSCESFAEAIVERARGTRLGAGPAAAVDAHLENCEVCRARLERERQLSAALHALAGSTTHAAAPLEVERRLVKAFARKHRVRPRDAASPRVLLRIGRLQVAAALAVLGITAAAGAVLLQDPRPRPDTISLPTAEPGQAVTSHGLDRADAATTSDSRGAVSRGRAQHGRRGETRQRPRPVQPASSIDDFVPLPAAMGLPALESGQIVRIDVPVASLPAYGVEIVPSAGQGSVQADFLVGQDGYPRAIRLVQAGEHARSRQ